MASVTSSAQGGATYDDVVIRDVHNYCFNLTILEGNDFNDHKIRLIEAVDNLISDIETHSGKQIESFTIGKSGCIGRKGRNINKETVLDAYNWRASSGPGNRWKNQYSRDSNGMVVIAGIIADVVPKIENVRAVHQEHYALALEQALIHEFRLIRRDGRCKNETLSSGSISVSGNVIGCVYFVFKLSKERRDLEVIKEEDHEVVPNGITLRYIMTSLCCCFVNCKRHN